MRLGRITNVFIAANYSVTHKLDDAFDAFSNLSISTVYNSKW